MTMSNRIAVMMEGEILQCGTPADIYNDPADIHVAEFIGSPKINIIPAEIAGDGAVSVFGSDLALRTQGPAEGVRLGIRPESLFVSPGRSLLSGVVRHTENLGAEVFAQLEIPGLSDRIVVRLEPKSGIRLKLGEALSLGFQPENAVLFDAQGKRLPAHVLEPMKAAANG